MWQEQLMASVVSGALMAAAGGLLAADPQSAPAGEPGKAQLARQEPIYGSQLMTREERIEHRNKMRSLRTAEEREQYRLEHHAKMQERAREKGVTLPDPPSGRGMRRGMGPGGGMGPGMGPGGGMGRGMGQGMGPGPGMGPGCTGAGPCAGPGAGR